jgi:hypothetical protein
MCSEGLAVLVPVEKRREDFQRQSECNKQRVPFQRPQNHVSQFSRDRGVLAYLHIVLGPSRLVACSSTPIYPLGFLKHLAGAQDLVWR